MCLVCIAYLATGFDSLDETEKYDEPGQHQAQGQLPVRASKVRRLDSETFFQDFLTEVLAGAGFSQGDWNVKQSLDRIFCSGCFIAISDVGEDTGNHGLAAIDLNLFRTLVPVSQVTSDNVQALLVLDTGPEMRKGWLKMSSSSSCNNNLLR